MTDVPERRSWCEWLPTHLSIRVLMVVVAIVGCGLGWLGRARLKEAEAAYQKARRARQVAEMAAVEYEHAVFKQEWETILGEVALADAELRRAEDQMAWAERLFARRGLRTREYITGKINLQQKTFALEQAKTKKAVLEKSTYQKAINQLKRKIKKARSDELDKKADYEQLMATGLRWSW